MIYDYPPELQILWDLALEGVEPPMELLESCPPSNVFCAIPSYSVIFTEPVNISKFSRFHINASLTQTGTNLRVIGNRRASSLSLDGSMEETTLSKSTSEGTPLILSSTTATTCIVCSGHRLFEETFE